MNTGDEKTLNGLIGIIAVVLNYWQYSNFSIGELWEIKKITMNYHDTVGRLFKNLLLSPCYKAKRTVGFSPMAYNVSGLCVVALSRNLKLTTTLDRAITQNPCYVPLNWKDQSRSLLHIEKNNSVWKFQFLWLNNQCWCVG